MKDYFIKLEKETFFDMDKGKEVTEVLYDVEYKQSKFSMYLKRFVIILCIQIIVWFANIVVPAASPTLVLWMHILFGLFTLFVAIVIIQKFVYLESFDSRVKAENYIKYLKKKELER